MMKEILLISANTYKVPYPVYPIGMLYLQTYLTNNLPGFTVTNFDCNLDSLDQLKALLQKREFSYVGISLRNADDVNFYHKDSFAGWYRQILEVVRADSNAVTIVGGSCFSIFPVEFYEFLGPDYGIKGEGELALVNLIQTLENKLPVDGIDGLVHKKDGRVLINPRKNFINSLDLSLDERLSEYYWGQSGMLNIQTKRGCPYNCIYCSYPVIEGTRVRLLDPVKVVDTIEIYRKEHGIDYFFFTDSVFNINDKYNLAFAEELIRRDLKINWGAYFSPFRMNYKSMETFRNSGLSHVEFGTDSFSDRQLKNMQKHFTFEEVLETSKICYDLNIFYAHFLILGGYGETEETLNETFENSKKIDFSVFFPFIGMRIYPQTRLHEIAIREGRLSEDDSLLEPLYYVSDQVNMDTIKQRALATGKKWIFPDDDHSAMLEKMRSRNKKGPLWEFLRY